MVFFEPTKAFIDYLRKLSLGRGIIDVGAGCGLLSSVLANAGFKVLAIDIIPRDQAYHPVALLDATEMQFPAHCLPVMARPCHSEWIDKTIDNALRHASQFLYVGLERNFATDLGELAGKYKLTYEQFEAGNDGETAVLIEKRT